ncbi:DNA polymerase/3'-5' exonuclease PolX [Alkaliphilus crotonatoxidans]
MDKYKVSIILEEIGKMLELKGENPFKIRAYYTGARLIENTEEDLEELVKEKRLNEIRGIGKALETKITELIETGELAYYEKLRRETPEGLFELLKIPGLGPKKIKELYERLHIASVAELENACMENRLIDLKGFGEKTQRNILEGIEDYKKRKGQFLISTALFHGERIVDKMKSLPQVLEISLAGSIRRQKEIVKDIDIIACCRPGHEEEVMDHFVQLPEVNRMVAKGPTKSSVILQAGINVDLRLVEPEAYPHALQHFTGNKDHNTALRHRAKKLGFKVNEYGIYEEEKRILLKDEEAIYQALGLAYIPPELREDRGELEAAERGGLPQLVTQDDLKGIFHVHSHYSDGIHSIEELVQKAIAMEFQYIGISDHSQSAIYARGLGEAAIKRQHEEIDRLSEKYPQIKILKGIESDILPDGSLDYSDDILASFDYVIGSIHSNFHMGRAAMTSRLLKAIDNQYLSIVGHITGRLLLSRRGYELDLESVIEACGKRGIAIEINSNPHRLDLDWRMVQYAKEHGVKLAIEPDAHRAEEIDNICYGIGVARKGWLEAADIINSLPFKEVIKFFQGR